MVSEKVKIIGFFVVLALITAGIFITVNFIFNPTLNQLLILSDEDFQKYNPSGSGTETDPYVIENRRYRLVKDDTQPAVKISGTTKYFIIRKCEIAGGSVNLDLNNIGKNTAKFINNTFETCEYCERISIIDKSCHQTYSCMKLTELEGISFINNYFVGVFDFREKDIHIDNCKNVIFKDNTFNHISSSLSEGIEFTNSIDVIFQNNTIFNVNYGITRVSFHNCSNINIDKNSFSSYGDSSMLSVFNCENATINDNYFTYLEDPHGFDQFVFGIYIYANTYKETYCNISNNILFELYYGIVLEGNITGVNIFQNILEECTEALRCGGFVCNSTIFQNNFLDNSDFEDSQAKDDGYNNLWYHPILLEGNYWTDNYWATYDIDGSAGSIDLYPLSEPFEI